MTNIDPTIQAPMSTTQQLPPPAALAESQPPVEVRGTTSHGVMQEVRPEDPKRNPVTYVALAIATLALLLSIAALTRDNGPDQIDVGGKRCIVDRIPGNDADTLFCQS